MSFATDENPAPLPPWGIPATIAWVLAALLAGMILAAAFNELMQVDRAASRGLTYNGVGITTGLLVMVPVQIAVLSVASQLRRWRPADYFGLNVPKRGEIVLGAIAIVAITVVFDLTLYLTGRDLVPPFQVQAYESARDAGWLVALTLAIVVVAPVGEELAFRGFLYRGVARPGREMFAIAAISLAWTLLHFQYDWLGMVQVFAAGLMLGWFRWASGSTTLAIVMHMLINLEAMIETAIKLEWLS